mmetsp:Transcript_10592/g.23510  ORF Transcript_10592/g.23510 Transcript_10592/m.23510 type:complete len:200 (-) Transcript_10592:673-1272(-)
MAEAIPWFRLTGGSSSTYSSITNCAELRARLRFCLSDSTAFFFFPSARSCIDQRGRRPSLTMNSIGLWKQNSSQPYRSGLLFSCAVAMLAWLRAAMRERVARERYCGRLSVGLKLAARSIEEAVSIPIPTPLMRCAFSSLLRFSRSLRERGTELSSTTSSASRFVCAPAPRLNGVCTRTGPCTSSAAAWGRNWAQSMSS